MTNNPTFTAFQRIVFSILVLLISGYTAHAQQSFQLKGTVSADVDLNGKYVFLSVLTLYGGFSPVVANAPDSSLVENGKFSFVGTMDMPGKIASFKLQSSDQPIETRIMIMAGENEVKIYPALYDPLTGSALHKLSNLGFSRKEATLFDRYSKINQLFLDEFRVQVNQLERSGKAASQEKMQAMYKESQVQAFPVKLSLIDVNKENYTSLYLMKYFLMDEWQNRPMPLLAAFYNLDESLKDLPEGQEISAQFKGYEEITSKTKGIDFALTNLNGDTVRLSDFRGKKVLLDFWSSTCIPCIQDLPKLRAYHQAHPDVQLIAISLDERKADWQDAIKRHKFDFGLHLSDLKGFKGDVANRMFRIEYIPRKVLIDEEGILIDAYYELPK